MAYNDIAIPKGDCGRRDLSRNHLGRAVVEVLIVRSVPRIAKHQADMGTSARTTTTLGVVVRARWHVSEEHGVQAADIDPHFKGG